MWRPLRDFYIGSFEAALETNRRNILSLVRPEAGTFRRRLLDLGCDDGSWTVRLAEAAGATEAHGVELVTEAARAAGDRGIQVRQADLNEALPYESASFDLVHSNQVIEHVADIDLFVSEIRRVLRPGGVAVVSTENGSSWHNIFAAVLGWQMFSLTNVSGRVAGLGNPLAVHRNASAFSPTWRHRTIMNYRGLIELFQVHEFENVQIAGAGYYPLPAVTGRLDARHSAFLALKASTPVA